MVDVYLRRNSNLYVKFPIRIWSALELWPKNSHSERRPVRSYGTYIGFDDDDKVFLMMIPGQYSKCTASQTVLTLKKKITC